MYSLNNSINTLHRCAIKTSLFANKLKLNFANFPFRSILFRNLIYDVFMYGIGIEGQSGLWQRVGKRSRWKRRKRRIRKG